MDFKCRCLILLKSATGVRQASPDVLILFHNFLHELSLKQLKNLRFDYIASGHYAHAVRLHFENAEGSSVHHIFRDKKLS